ncbi:MAG: DUF4124 domain-containing protein [Gammaproteobacteria bacterium]|nr:DUF4124 domain-containing protein [Gammaproteobacteria bacterium]
MKQRHEIRHAFISRILAAGLAAVVCSSAGATEVHTWTDEQGVTHYSDAPRGEGESRTIEVEEIYRPGTADAYQAEDAPQAPVAASTDAETTGDSPASTAQERRERLARQRTEKREAQEELDKLCGLHRDRLERVEPARRVMYTDDSGELVRLDDDQRMAMVEESRSFLEDNCPP